MNLLTAASLIATILTPSLLIPTEAPGPAPILVIPTDARRMPNEAEGPAVPPTSSANDAPYTLPAQIRGRFTIVQNLSERTLGCFNSSDTQSLIGLHVTVTERELIWNHQLTTGLDPRPSNLSTYAFQARYGKLPQDLGLPRGNVTVIDVHPSTGIPVNAIIEVTPEKILINACNMWLEAIRTLPS